LAEEKVQMKMDITKPMQVGGQAVIEGVMMRAPGMVATAVRRADGSVTVRKEPHRSLAERYPALKFPVLRGALALVEMLILGIQTLNFSAEMAMRDAEGGGNGSNGDGSRPSRFRENLVLGLTVTVAFAAAIALFFVVPLLLTSALPDIGQLPLAFNLIAGMIRVALFLLYLSGISMLKDVKRLFQYHGAEHKAVFAFERGLALEPATVRTQSRLHPRCGTSFLLVVMLAAIILFALLDTVLIGLFGSITLAMRLATHLPLVPLVGGISYEFIKLSAKYSGTTVGEWIVAPGLWLQRITTQEPDDSQLEVAIAALTAALNVQAESSEADLQVVPAALEVNSHA
jgi:uncharacterized protein YqhQ